MIETPQVTTMPATTTAVIRLHIPCEDCRKEFSPAVSEILAELASQGIKPAGPLFDHHFSTPGTHFDFEIGFPTATPVKPAGRVKPSERPQFKAAKTVLHGDYEQLPDAWPEFMKWVSAQGLPHAADFWQIFATGPESSDNPDDWRTELVRPLTA